LLVAGPLASRVTLVAKLLFASGSLAKLNSLVLQLAGFFIRDLLCSLATSLNMLTTLDPTGCVASGTTCE
jgi:hypothetical protein